MGWFEQVKSPKLKQQKKVTNNTPTGLWKKCSNCGEIVQSQKLEECFQVCPYCDHHFRLSARERLRLLVDDGSFKSYEEAPITTSDPLAFVDKASYQDRLKAAHAKTGLEDGTFCGKAKVNGDDLSIAVMNFEFMGGSMGVVTGEKVAMALEKSLEQKIPALVVCCSGGARMQEGILSLMQMAKTSGVISRLRNEGIPFISLLTDPTTGGVAASFALLGDVNIAEPKALIGFAGPRVIEQSIRQTLPEGFQRSEFLHEHGFVDRVIHRHQLKEEIHFFMKMFKKD
tara:strand:- start:4119 stop:4973 length:855 start_codon:yes stop_codon:yes gene_type:complete